ncbi:MAG: hypothetical protein FJZ00_12075 [Candidatus Sericytochromatia bacterium]|uniref:Uncharacterized protein n=1 Tax=Candidatus Tanganyikabacteria bacterium TaxID=2961651 RepID=A0A938BNZ5_9BACT|nr:hypothetical protein [Candidatus Tanganyikabacteria bacterium]
MDPVTSAAVSAGVSLAVAGGGAVYSYGRHASQVGEALARIADVEKRLEAKIDSKADRTQFEELHKDVREIRDMLQAFIISSRQK